MLIGIDIGGTKISVTLGDKKGNIFQSTSLSSSHFSTADEGVKAICKEIEKHLQESKKSLSDLAAVGIASPGPIDTKTGKMLTPPNLPQWHHYPLVSSMEKVLHKPIFFNNDANGAALAEYHFGHLHGIKNMIYLTVSTGMGGGVIVDGKLLQGITDTGGEVGHIILDREGPLCHCGLKGCFEAFCGGKNVALQVQEGLRSGISSKMLKMVGATLEKVDMKIILNAVREKDEYACSIWNEFVERMAQGIGGLLQAFNPEAILLGTIAVYAKDLMMAPLREKLIKYSWKEPLSACKIEPSKLGTINHQLSPMAIALEGLKE